jgi:malonyl-CoA O-methyltransferase
MEAEQAAVVELLPDLQGLTVLDAGCGTGRYVRICADRGATVIGVDLSEAMLSRARAISPRLTRASLIAMPFDNMSVDAIVCGLALGDVAEIDLAMSECARLLRPGGTLVYSVVHPDGASRGWQRSFEASGRTVSIDSYWHTPGQHRRACAAAGLTIDGWVEPSLAASPDEPVALVVRARH